MIRISKLTDYAMLILNYMAHHPEHVLSTSIIAEKLYLNTPTVSKILKILTDAKLVISHRGAEGGYTIALPGSKISLMDIIVAMEGEIAMVSCCSKEKACQVKHSCTMRNNWQLINKKVQSLLAKFTIIEMSNPLSLSGFDHV